MIRTMYAIYPHGSVYQTFVLWRMGERKLVVMEEYEDLVCRKCGKVDERAALDRGISARVSVKSKRPFLGSADHLYLLDARARRVFEDAIPDDIRYYSIPASSFFVAFAKDILEPDEDNPGFRFVGARCADCHRPREVVWSKSPPRIIGTRSFVSVNLESVKGARPTWLVSGEVADQLRRSSPPLTGLVLDPREVEDGETNG